MIDLAKIERQLQTLVSRKLPANAKVSGLFAFEEGHTGTTLGFSLALPEEGGRDLVLKLAPFGVVRRGASDIYRQAFVLKKLHGYGLPVPEVLFASPLEADFGTPFLIMERMPGKTFVVWEPHHSHDLTDTSIDRIWLLAARQLAKLHTFNWQRELGDWETPRQSREELENWLPILKKALDPVLIGQGAELASQLLKTLPRHERIGLAHGDYQPGNLLYEDGHLCGIIDWDLVSIGPIMLDLGWLLMMSDKICWHPDWPPYSNLRRSDLIAEYEKAAGLKADAIDWYQALSCFRMGAIACHNIRLHRTGRRTDDLWDRFEPSVPHLFARGQDLLRGCAKG